MTEVFLDVTGGIAVVTLNAPERRNAFTREMVRELINVCDQIDADESIGAVVIKANGDSFCSGAHRALLANAGRDPATTEHYRAIGVVYDAFVRVGDLLPPTIAAVRGDAVGAGVNLMLATDLRIVAETARIVSGFQRIGIHPGGGHFSLLSRLAGREATAAMSLFGDEINGHRAAEIGLAWEAVPEAAVEFRALELAHRPARDPELARATVRSFRLELGPPAIPWAVSLEVERAIQMWSLRRKAQSEG